MISAAIAGCSAAATRVNQEALNAFERMLVQLPKLLAASIGGSNGEAGWLHSVLASTVSRTGSGPNPLYHRDDWVDQPRAMGG